MSTLILLPNVLSEEEGQDKYLPAGLADVVKHLDALVVESEKEGRRFLKRFPFDEGKTFRDVQLYTLNEHTSPEELKELVQLVKKHSNVGVVSDCGLPCLADPGAKLVEKAREAGVSIEGWMGPSAIILALMLSGFSGQRFAFYGYLKKEAEELKKQLKEMEKRAVEEKETQLFIEAPYRSSKMLTFLLENLSPNTKLCVACDLNSGKEEVWVHSISEWRKKSQSLDLNKRPCVFLFKKDS